MVRYGAFAWVFYNANIFLSRHKHISPRVIIGYPVAKGENDEYTSNHSGLSGA